MVKNLLQALCCFNFVFAEVLLCRQCGYSIVDQHEVVDIKSTLALKFKNVSVLGPKGTLVQTLRNPQGWLCQFSCSIKWIERFFSWFHPTLIVQPNPVKTCLVFCAYFGNYNHGFLTYCRLPWFRIHNNPIPCQTEYHNWRTLAPVHCMN